jgi:hypothetical protein
MVGHKYVRPNNIKRRSLVEQCLQLNNKDEN